MSVAFRKRIEKRLYKKEKKYETEQLMKDKRSEEYEVLEDTVESNQRV